MDRQARMRQYDLSARREEEAAACAVTREGARLHRALAAMYRHQAAAMDAVRQALRSALS